MYIYNITFDIKIGRHWLAGGNSNGWSNRYVLGTADARSACSKLERAERKLYYDGKRISGFRVMKVEQVAQDVLVK